MKQIVILGGGTAGSIVSNRLYRQLPQNEYQITVVDRDNNHHYQPGSLCAFWDVQTSHRGKETLQILALRGAFCDGPNQESRPRCENRGTGK